MRKIIASRIATFFSFLSIAVTLAIGPMARAANELIFKNPVAMTLTQAVTFPSVDSSQSASVNLLPSRKPAWLLEDRHDLRFRFNLQLDRNAPVVFIIPGAGGTSSSPGALALAEKIHAQGYQTVTLDAAFSWTFAVSGSRSTLPGYTPDDAVDLYAALTEIKAFLRTTQSVRPREFSLVGFSLGALESIFLKKLDDKRKTFGFSKVVMINPPVDLLYALRGIDAFYESGARLSKQRQNWVYGRVIAVGEKYLGQGETVDFSRPDFLNAAFTDLNFEKADMIFLIGQAFHRSLRDVIFVSQQVSDRNILKSRVGRYFRSQRYEEAASFSYLGYVQQFLLPSLQERMHRKISVTELNNRASLYQFGDDLIKQKNVFAFHSEDDFLLKPGDLMWLRKKFGNRLFLFPYGGHLGAMNFPHFAERLKILFPPPP